MLTAELADCYVGRLPTFLNLRGRQPGAGSAIMRRTGGRGARTPEILIPNGSCRLPRTRTPTGLTINANSWRMNTRCPDTQE
jgi:hypothetical protein